MLIGVLLTGMGKIKEESRLYMNGVRTGGVKVGLMIELVARNEKGPTSGDDGTGTDSFETFFK